MTSNFNLLKGVIFGGYVCIMLWKGVRNRGGLGSWRMFSYVWEFTLNMEVRAPRGTWKRLDQNSHIPKSVSGTVDLLIRFIDYLKNEKGLEVRGTCEVQEGFEKILIEDLDED